MAVVLVTGGTGTLGRSLVPQLRAADHEVRVLSRRPGAGTHVGDLLTGAGVADAAIGASVVVHLASDTRRLGRRDVEQTRHVLSAAHETEHLVYISIVGIDAIPYRYYREKLACEQMVHSSGIPSTTLRATQFHELLALALHSLRRLPVAPLLLDFRFQPVAASEVAERLVEIVGAPPVGRVADMGGPEVLELATIAEVWQAHHGWPRRTVPLPLPGRVAAGFRAGRNTCPERATGRQTWAEFVASGSD